MSERLRIGFVGTGPVDNRWIGSGIPYSSARVLAKYCGEPVELGPFAVPKAPMLRRIVWKLERDLLGKRFRWQSSHKCCRIQADRVSRSIREKGCDVVFSCMAGWTVALLEDDIPIFSFTDGTGPVMRKAGWYEPVKNLARRSIRMADQNEGQLLRKAVAVLVTGRWPGDSVVNDYGIPPQKVFITPYGANVLAEEIPPIEHVREKKLSQECRILFVGRTWVRKGGDIALETLVALEGLGIKARLVVVGCTPPEGVRHERMTVIPSLDKRDPQEAKELFDLFRQSDFFLMPTRSEAFGIVYAEANAFGLPAIGTDAGGVSDAIRPGENGFLLPFEARGEQYAELIADMYSQPQRYQELVRSSRKAFEQRLNWDTWGRTVAGIMKQVLPTELAEKVGPP